MTTYNFTKDIAKPDKLQEEIFDAGLESISYIETIDDQIYIHFSGTLSGGEQSTLSAIVASHSNNLTLFEQVKIIAKSAETFGRNLITEMTTENIILGITQAGMTNVVRKRAREVTGALATGSLYDAIYEMRHMPAENKDSTFITDARLLAGINKVETYLNLPLSESL